VPDHSDEHAPLIDERAAAWAAALVAPRRREDAATVAALRLQVHEDLPRLDAAARGWSELGADLPPTTATVVGRSGFVRANLASLRGAFEPLRERLERRPPGAATVLGVQLGALLGLLSSKVLGQYVLPFGGPGGGQLLIVGPNVLALADEHGELATDIRRTVVLHEITHRLQFDGTPWLGDHLRDLLAAYLADARVDSAVLAELAPRLPEVIAEVRRSGSVQPLLHAVLTDEQAELIEQAQGLMSLLEGHGNAAMYDAADRDLIGDPEGVREALARRRTDLTARVLTAVAGLEMKKRQYREGEAFVRGVLDRAGVEGLNRAFAAPEHLPRADEVDDPAGWLARVGHA
jgi:coenzyme F420 biosynthesis associated uncharacterized protein